ncbi:sensor histidine kinase [Allosediminivita pacifica]|uniref:histidine kinase n=1 Tax=Allosediminivita pacifica TaxID=1267769 RepID=A0A2T6AUI7_9RHOB|nr:hybrid sensor histidine kinase/response regulator [Allosediminivita pacifica]PTX47475.1 hypothetical protein C8N44_11299 [Allosediminivita pacifica]GGB14472.1 hypothetical protein GCM10011324_25850 [Allosediminivita pacifica]
MAEACILVLDDDLGDRKFVRRLLGRVLPQVSVREAADASELLGWEGKPPDIVMVDYMLPTSNGLELLPRLRDSWPDAGIIMLTGKGDEEIAKSAIQGGAADYIPKQSLSVASLHRIVWRTLEKVRLQARIRAQREELEVFASVLVHDLKAPIRAVNFLSGELAEDIASGEMAEVGETLRLLQKSAEKMRNMVDSLAAHIQIDRGVELEKTDISDVVDTALLALREEIAQSGCVISQELRGHRVEGSAPQLAQLLQNLVSNAIKYAGDAPPDVAISAQADGEAHVLISVSDHGIGIPPDFVDRVFEPFRRAPTTQGVEGTGLGLATCRKIVERHHGRIWCESEPGAGTTIRIRLPLAQPEADPLGFALAGSSPTERPTTVSQVDARPS